MFGWVGHLTIWEVDVLLWLSLGTLDNLLMSCRNHSELNVFRNIIGGVWRMIDNKPTSVEHRASEAK